MLRTRMRLLSPRTPGRSAQRAAHDQFDIDAGLRGAIQRLNDVLVEQGIDFRDDERRAARLGVRGFPLDQADAVFSQVQRRHGQRAVLRPLGIRRQVIEDVMHGFGDLARRCVSRLRSV